MFSRLLALLVAHLRVYGSFYFACVVLVATFLYTIAHLFGFTGAVPILLAWLLKLLVVTLLILLMWRKK